jgi:lipid-binding SYLF domain-containing protein
MFLIAFTLIAWGGDKQKDEDTLKDAAIVLHEMIEKDLPPELVSKAYCMMVLPSVKKFGLGIGASAGRGPLVCRRGGNFNGKWSAPAMYSLGGLSAGLQVGGSSTDVVLLILGEKGVNTVLNHKAKLGEDAAATAGAIGATTTLVSGSDILSYGMSTGLFAGVSLGGASLEPDQDANRRLYGKAITARDIVRGSLQTPPGAESLIALLDTKATNRSN